ncbi:FUSC family protein [Bacillus benzoevorans]|uniref:Uncharacterized membrane protein YgaE (UPF0421/DUF939 family) n=1 Tax=Bacillus benzoevorans TaxID=1456 RepID=A0A7X0HNW5_9BACI|nr:aromatic acid exporter family protein [Bacillus benzoevorans]MBB6444046.1 uncharacterized membrane protein YgaE (UPF0421/DUF939 family) [Bacillus benzoevorans]
MKIGPRVLKTGLAVTLALYVCSLLHLESAVFAGMAAIFTMQPSIYRAWKQAWDQVQTNILGAIIAFLGLYFLGNDPFSIGLVMIIVILISMKLKMTDSISLTLVTVLAIMSAPGDDDYLFALQRFSLTFIGMTSALLVNIFVSPPNYKKTFVKKVQTVFQNMSILIRTAVSNEMTAKSFQEQMRELEKDILNLEEEFRLFDEERENFTKLSQMNLREIVVFKQMFKSLQQGYIVLEDIDSFYFQCKPTEEEDLLFDQQLELLIKYHELCLLKYDGKIKIDEPPLKEDILKQTNVFVEQVIDSYQQDHKVQLTVISSSIYHYAYQIERLNRVIEQYLKK